ncbi:MAG: fatty acid desaturase, partial [Acidobacteriota bacterium]
MLKVGERLEGVDMKELSQINPMFIIGRLFVLLVICAASIAAILMGPLWAQVMGTIVLGLMYAHAVELQHQCLHNTAFSSKGWNRLVGFLLGLPTLVSHSDYQHQHLRHHRYLGREGDREFFNYGYDRLS